MRIDKKDYLEHYGVLGMHWGVHKQEDKTNTSHLHTDSEKQAYLSKVNDKILKANPEAHVINYSAFKNIPKTQEEIDARNKKIRNIAIGVGVGVTLAAGAYLYATHKGEVDKVVGDFLEKSGTKKVGDIQTPSKLTFVEKLTYSPLGVKAKENEPAADFITSWVSKVSHNADPLTDEVYNGLDDKEFSLKPGQVIKRITTAKDEVLRAGAFVSFDENDNNRYAAFLPAMRHINAQKNPMLSVFDKQHYQMTMKAVEEIKSPSAKQRVDMLSDMLKNDETFVHRLNGTLNCENFEFGKTDSVDFAKKHYKEFAANLCNNKYSDSMAQKYMNEAIRRGYNALIDDNDAGKLAKAPLILLDPKVVKTEIQTELTKLDRLNAIKNIMPMEGEDFKTTQQIMRNLNTSIQAKTYYEAMIHS